MLGLLAAALLAVAGSPAPEPAASGPVVMIERPAGADPVLQETSLRLRAELAAAGYSSRMATCAVDPLAGPADCPRDETLASISLARANDTTSIFVTSRRRSGLELRRQVRVQAQDGGGDATLLAVRAVELLRDLQLEVAQAAHDDEDPKPLEPFTEPPASTGPRFYLMGGAEMLFTPWANTSHDFPALGGVVGLGARLGQRFLLIVDGAGPFAITLPIGSPIVASGPRTQRNVYQAIGRLALRVGGRSGVEGPFATFFAGAVYMDVQLDPLVSNGPGQVLSPLVGFDIGYTVRITPSLIVAGEVELIDSPWKIEIDDRTRQSLTDSSYGWVAVNVTAALGLP
jgi:hypothetical protein